MIRQSENLFVLETNHTTYAFHVTDSGHLEHLYYGPLLGAIDGRDAFSLSQKRSFEIGNAIVLDPEHPQIMLEDLRLEMSGPGKGDIREPFAEVIFSDGSRTVDFRYLEASISDKVSDDAQGMPLAYDETGNAQELTITLYEKSKPVKLDLIYDVFPECDVICRRTRIRNEGGEAIYLERLMSTQLDFVQGDYMLRGFFGAWAREMQYVDMPINAGKTILSSTAGTSSNRTNPFCILYEEGTTEHDGICYGLNLVYSGNHYEAFDVNAYGKVRFVSGINPQGFLWKVDAGEAFDTPQAVMTVTDSGFSEMSHAMHHFVQEHIVRGTWKHKPRPVLLNSWEASYFDIDERKLLRLAARAKDAGIELFVMDDGWFGKRDDDHSSLGDWTPNPRKLPNGLAGICNKVRMLGLDFGVWVEPEMVNVDSDLYRAHPDWAMEIPGREHSEGRTQRILDLANDAVVDHLIEAMTAVFSSAEISYVKWDMNRIFSDVYSRALPADQQGETAHRYMLGLYRLMRTLTERFPEILFEGCASGGNRFDLGILSYFPQIWASDNTDAISRARIQEGYSFGYPPSVMGNHVSGCPNHQTLRETPIETRYNIASFGLLGYELNLVDLSDKDRRKIRQQVAQYKKWRDVLQFGDFYRGGTANRKRTHTGSELKTWTVVSPDKSRAIGMILQELVVPNTQYTAYQAAGLDPTRRYSVSNIPHAQNIMRFGDLINMKSPVHIRQNSHTHYAISKRIDMPGEKEEHETLGSVLMKAGIRLQPGFSGSGYDGTVRYFQDFSSRVYYIEALPEEKIEEKETQTAETE
ncbi:MAG: alpha-galactosidase [Mogibacterium sp.]|nr:alpha-galactosidase [Mogibacterium sp.]